MQQRDQAVTNIQSCHYVPLWLNAHMQANHADRYMTQHTVTLITLLAPNQWASWTQIWKNDSNKPD